jgi:hypothetical protein
MKRLANVALLWLGQAQLFHCAVQPSSFLALMHWQGLAKLRVKQKSRHFRNGF